MSMNFLAHFLIASEAVPSFSAMPSLTAGSALPDLLPLAAPRQRLRFASLASAPCAAGEESALHCGVRVHLATDAAFHKTAAFAAAQADVWQIIDETGFAGIRVRRFFLAHILVEIGLDAVLLRADPALAERFYALLAAADHRQVARWTEVCLGRDAPRLPKVLAHFAESRYLLSYAHDAGVTESIRRLSVRARQDAFTGSNADRLQGLVSAAMDAISGHAAGLLRETCAGLAGDYPALAESLAASYPALTAK